jgi:hypothetical protein
MTTDWLTLKDFIACGYPDIPPINLEIEERT